MKRYVLWFLAVLITLGAALYQRLTGPTYPYRAQAVVDGQAVTARLPRSAENVADCEVKLRGIPGEIGGYLEYMRYKTQDPWTRLPLERSQGALGASLPKQPAAGKLAYRVVLTKGGQEVVLSGDKPVVIRFKGVVPNWVLIPHIIIMFLAMLMSTAAGLAAFGKKSVDWPKLKPLPGLLLFVIGAGVPFAVTESPAYFDSAPRFKSKPLGLTARNLTYEVRRYFQKKDDEPGVILSNIEAGSKASVAGLKPYEIITAVNEKPVKDVKEFEAAVTSGGDELRLNVLRMIKTRIVKISLKGGEASGAKPPIPTPPPADEGE